MVPANVWLRSLSNPPEHLDNSVFLIFWFLKVFTAHIIAVSKYLLNNVWTKASQAQPWTLSPMTAGCSTWVQVSRFAFLESNTSIDVLIWMAIFVEVAVAQNCLSYASLVITMHICVRKTANFPHCRGKRTEGSLAQGFQTRVGKLEGQLGSLHCAWCEGLKRTRGVTQDCRLQAVPPPPTHPPGIRV